MYSVFFVAFGVGVGYAVLNLIFGNLLDLGDFEFGDVSDFNIGGSFLFKPAPLAALVTTFGGAGLILYGRLNIVVVIIACAVVGVVVAFIFTRFILIPLHKAQNTSTVEKQSMVGKVATVTEKIFADSFGKITYHINGSNISSPAKSEDGEEIATGTPVIIVYIDKNIFYVKPKF